MSTYTVELEKFSHEGRAITHIDGKIVFVDGALPGETAKIKIFRKKKDYREAYTLEVLKAADERVEPECPHFGVCGGCQLQHMNRDTQIQVKQNTMLELLTRSIGKEPESVLPPLCAGGWGYRRKARIGMKYVPKKEKLLIGFREKYGPGKINDSHVCKILDPDLGEKIEWLRSKLENISIRDQIPQIEIAQGDNCIGLVFRHLQPFNSDDIKLLKDIGNETGWHIYLQPGKNDSVHKIFPEDGEMLIEYRIPQYDIRLKFHPLDFTQVNADINKQLIELAINLLDPQPEDVILDLFCGLGNFSLPIAKHCKKVIGIEGELAMVERAKQNAILNNIKNTEFIAVDLQQSNPIASAKADKVLLDPPRTGAEDVCRQLVEAKPARIVYISCNPATMARDAMILTNNGYTVTHVGIMDMFPHTKHVESIAVFNRN